MRLKKKIEQRWDESLRPLTKEEKWARLRWEKRDRKLHLWRKKATIHWNEEEKERAERSAKGKKIFKNINFHELLIDGFKIWENTWKGGNRKLCIKWKRRWIHFRKVDRDYKKDKDEVWGVKRGIWMLKTKRGGFGANRVTFEFNE